MSVAQDDWSFMQQERRGVPSAVAYHHRTSMHAAVAEQHLLFLGQTSWPVIFGLLRSHNQACERFWKAVRQARRIRVTHAEVTHSEHITFQRADCL
jgi:hypothetical protein